MVNDANTTIVDIKSYTPECHMNDVQCVLRAEIQNFQMIHCVYDGAGLMHPVDL